MKGFKMNIEKAATENDNFRKVLYTSGHSQLVLMSLKPKEEIAAEIHHDNDQFFRIESGNGKCIINILFCSFGFKTQLTFILCNWFFSVIFLLIA